MKEKHVVGFFWTSRGPADGGGAVWQTAEIALKLAGITIGADNFVPFFVRIRPFNPTGMSALSI